MFYLTGKAKKLALTVMGLKIHREEKNTTFFARSFFEKNNISSLKFQKHIL